MGLGWSIARSVRLKSARRGFGLTTVTQIGRIIVLPVLPLKDNGSTSKSKEPAPDEGDPVMLVALNAKESVDWDRLRISVCRLHLVVEIVCADSVAQAKELVYHLEKPVNRLRGRLTTRVAQLPPMNPNIRPPVTRATKPR